MFSNVLIASIAKITRDLFAKSKQYDNDDETNNTKDHSDDKIIHCYTTALVIIFVQINILEDLVSLRST